MMKMILGRARGALCAIGATTMTASASTRTRKAFEFIGLFQSRSGRIHFAAQCFVRAAAKLFPVKSLERIHLRRRNSFIDEERLRFSPPFVVSGLEFARHGGKPFDDVRLFSAIVL